MARCPDEEQPSFHSPIQPLTSLRKNAPKHRLSIKLVTQISVAQADKPEALVKLMDESRTRKGDFAQNLVAAFDSDATQASFQPPEYLVNAIKAVVGE